jgi:hypothetical protein
MITIPDLDGVVAAMQDDRTRAAEHAAVRPHLQSRKRSSTRFYSWITDRIPAGRVAVRREVRNA